MFSNQPASWDEDEDGIWKPPKVPNPAYRGPWKRKVRLGELNSFADQNFMIFQTRIP